MPSTRGPNPGSSEAILKGAAAAAARIGPAWAVIVLSAFLSAWGVLCVDVADALPSPNAPPPDSPLGLGPNATRQAIYAGIGVCLGLVAAIVHYRRWGPAAWALLAAALALLVLLLIPAVPSELVRPRNGARSWIDLGPVDFQPSEFTKIAWALALAWSLRFSTRHRSLPGLLPAFALTALPVALIMLQPDLGTACLFVTALAGVLIAAGARLRHLLLIALVAVLAAPLAFPLLRPHQKERIVGLARQFTGQATEQDDINYQGLTAQRLIAAGGLTGRPDHEARLLLRHNPLPERHNDMIFAVLTHRFGLLGALVLLAAYFLWITSALWVAARCREPFGRLLVVGLVGFVATQVVINVGMNLGLLPIIGITLPFISHGGTSMVTVWIIAGLIVSVSAREPSQTMRQSFEFDQR